MHFLLQAFYLVVQSLLLTSLISQLFLQFHDLRVVLARRRRSFHGGSSTPTKVHPIPVSRALVCRAYIGIRCAASQATARVGSIQVKMLHPLVNVTHYAATSLQEASSIRLEALRLGRILAELTA